MTVKRNVSIVATAALLALTGPALADSHVNAGTVVATVNGTEITLGHMIVLKQRLPQQYQQLPPDVLFDGILDQLVQQTLLGQQVGELSRGGQMTLDNEARALRAAEELRRVAADALTADAIREIYQETYGNAEPEQEFNASHILVETEEEAQMLVTELEGGADFAELAKEKSTGPSAPRGGELGWFGPGMMVAPFEEAMAALEAGQVSGPVQTEFGWHVIRLNETRMKDAPPLAEVRGQISEDIQREAIEAYIEELTGGAEIARSPMEDIDPALLDDASLLEE